ncbi:MAG: patatin-like phospholipase RssA [Syntrophales bacterium]|nr:patatin-like phospholipase RssA [Syntrophales bacterium]
MKKRIPERNNDQDMNSPDKTFKKIGLALGSGSARGWSHLGVIRAIREAGIMIDVVSGTSMGAMIAGAFAAGFDESLENWVRSLTWTDIFSFMDMTWPRAGLFEGDRLTNYLRENMTDLQIEDLPIPFASVATELNSGKEVWFREGSLMDAIRASMSMPGIMTPIQRNSEWLVDGGLVNPIPVSLCRYLGADVVIAVNLNSDIMGRNFLSRDNKASSKGNGKGSLSMKFVSLLNVKYRSRQTALLGGLINEQTDRGPSLIQVIAKSVYIMQDRITKQRLASDPPDILISPHLAHIGLLEFNRGEESIEEGYRAMKLMIPVLEDLISIP